MNTIKLNDDFSNLAEFEAVMSEDLKVLWDEFQEASANGFDYEDLKQWQRNFEPFGLSFDFGLDADGFDYVLADMNSNNAYTSIKQIENDINEGNTTIYYKSMLHFVDIHKDGYLVIASVKDGSSERLTKKHNPRDFFNNQNQ